ncbi:hypothetical protein RF11_08771 [Thelohanellus kitauei]|uniref:Generative cell specific-1/HAP2 domain-containing protein n=1 Tax=Thelohanellus kitauei TaxID=669202 RepID=A0A0C2N4K2_THEKT|nr:hypothetical protein RF11_08771 [Thelohanellus kitauei]
MIPRYEFDLSGKSCNKIGISYLGFEQSGSENAIGCQKHLNFCIENQPFQYVKRDNCMYDQRTCNLLSTTRVEDVKNNKLSIKYNQLLRLLIVVPYNFGNLILKDDLDTYLLDHVTVAHFGVEDQWEISGQLKKFDITEETVTVNNLSP